jgi:DNA invertase Pin-like site-specific DNA recombinase
VLLSVAQWERETIGERTKDALQHRIRNGQRCGKLRFGYDLGPDGRTLIENPAEQEILRLVAELRETGRTLRAIAAELTTRGVPTKEGNPTWTHTTVDRLLKRAA